MKTVCFDIGGTAIKSALIDENRKIDHFQQIATPKTREDLLVFMDKVIQEHEPIRAITLSVPGAIDLQNGEIKGLSAIPYIHGVSWYELLAKYKVPVYLENDANCVGLSELAVDDTHNHFACVVCGTGIGGALIVNGQLIRGKQSYGGEFGYMMINGMATPLQNWSQLASTGSLVRFVQQHKEKQDSEWNGKKIFEQAEEGDAVCQAAIQRMVQHFSVGLMNIFYCFNPDVIYIGGSISQNVTFIRLVQEELQRLVDTYEDFPDAPMIKACTYTNHANLMGAYMNTLQDR